ncbi:hypothetical protein BDV95DRAFT_522903 [Massariosphaeria phaeospora]|uniref:N-acetyltransferase domain-containing protein n=1 Tax=Massariosphaeria phaeospora TaxID=100035 RepID=A0A7C8MLV9_9PLEO|nr:hypothetical protein BDV95DRAFT_522903 [Massariosphaeria phaeospora]
MEAKEWRRTVNDTTFLISTARNLPHAFIQRAFANPAMSWAAPMSPTAITTMLANSCTLGLYRLTINTNSSGSGPERHAVGLARLITDYTTFAYLTDVYVVDECRQLGLGTWLVRCCRELVAGMPALRWMMLLTASQQAQRLYGRELGMTGMAEQKGLVAMGARKQALEEAGAEAEAAPLKPPSTSE